MSSTTLVPALLGFVLIFGVWILAERLHRSAVLAMVACGRVLGQSVPASTVARDGAPAQRMREIYLTWREAALRGQRPSCAQPTIGLDDAARAF